MNVYVYGRNKPTRYIDPFGLAVVGEWIEPPKINIEEFGFYWRETEIISPYFTVWGYLKFIRLHGSVRGFVNIDVRCRRIDPCVPLELEVHQQIPIYAYGPNDVGPNIYAMVAARHLGPYAGAAVNIIAIAGALLHAEYHLLQRAEREAGPIIAAARRAGPTEICKGNWR